MPSWTTLLVEDRGAVRIVTVNRPAVLNAIDAQVIDELTRVVDDTASAADVRALLLTGAGEKAFVAGADIAAMSAMNPEQALAFASRGHALGDKLAALEIPTLAAVNGFALGGGCELALACDFIFAADNAKFGQPEVKLGVIPGFGGTQRLARRVGLARALELCLTGAVIDANEAARIGVANRIVPRAELAAVAIATLETITQMGPLAIARCKAVLHEGASLPLADANRLEREAFAALFASTDQKEGMAAFLAKRPAKFIGR
jgi:enoyl-CoA hydratase